MKNFDFLTLKEKSYISSLIFHHKTTNLEKNISGYGTSFDSKLSILKSISEYVERLYFRQYFLDQGHTTTSGIACHSTEEKSRIAARNELIERHIFLTHWIQKIPPLWLSQLDSNKYLETFYEMTILDILSKKNYSIQFGILAIVNDVFVVISIISKNNMSGYGISTSSSNTISYAIKKCFEDSIRVADLIESRIINSQPLFIHLNKEDLKTPQDHLEYYLNYNNWVLHEWFFVSNPKIREYSISDIVEKTLVDIKTTGLELYISSAQSNSVQNLFFGPTKIEYLNNYNKGNFQNKCPHPLA